MKKKENAKIFAEACMKHLKYILLVIIALILAIIIINYSKAKYAIVRNVDKDISFCKLYYENVQTQERFIKLSDAIESIEAATESAQTIKVINTVSAEEASTVPENKKIILDLNGKTINTSQLITNNGTLIIEDSSEQKSGKISTGKGIDNNANLTIKSGGILAEANGISCINNKVNGKVLIEGGTITGNKYAISNAGTSTEPIPSLVITGGKFTSNADTAIYNSSSGTIQIDEGEISGVNYGAYNRSTGTININGGYYTVTKYDAIHNYSDGVINIKDGTITGKNYAVYNVNAGTINISGGEFSCEVYDGIRNSDKGTINIYGGNISGNNHGIAARGIVNIIGGTIIGETQRGIYFPTDSNAEVTIGNKETDTPDVNTKEPYIKGITYGITIPSTVKVYFYDGKIIGPTGKSIANAISEKQPGYEIQKTQVTDENGTVEEAILVEAKYAEYDNEQKAVNYYKTLDLAVKNVKEENVIKPLKNIEAEAAAEVPSTQKATLDLDGKTVKLAGSLTNEGELTIQGAGKLTAETEDTLINNGTFIKNGECTIDNTTSEAQKTLRNNGTANLNEGILTCSNPEIGPEYRYVIVNRGDLTISGATVTARAAADKENSNSDKAIINNHKMATLLIENDSKIESTGHAIVNGNSSVTASDSKNAIKVTGGEVLSVNQYAIYNNNSTEGVITVGEENSNSTSEPRIKGGIYSQGDIIVHSGQVTNETNNAKFCITSNGYVTITGGYISSSGNVTIRLGSKSGGKTLNISGNPKIECTGNEHSAIACSAEGQDPTIIVAGGEIISAGNRGITNALGDTIIYGDTKITSVAAGVYTDTGAIIIKAEENGNSNTATTGPIITAGTYGVYVGQNGSLTIGVKESTGNSVSATVPSITGATCGASVQSGTFNFYDGKITGKSGAGSAINGKESDKPEGYEIQKTQVTDESGTKGEEAILVKANYAEYTTGGEFVKGYIALSDAFSNGTSGNIINVLEDVEETAEAEVPLDKTFTLDLKDKTIKTNRKIRIKERGTLTVEGSQGGRIETSECIAQYGTFILNSGTINEIGAGNTILNCVAEAKTIINGGTIASTAVEHSTIALSYGDVTINGGTITSQSRAVASNDKNTDGTVTINGGTIKSTGASNTTLQVSAIYMAAGTLNISGGTFIAEVGESSKNAWALDTTADAGNVTITGGTFTGVNAGMGLYNSNTTISNATIEATTGEGIINNGNLTIKSGKITAENHGIENCENGKVLIEDGTITSKYYGINNYGTANEELNPAVKVIGGNITSTEHTAIVNNTKVKNANVGMIYVAGGTIQGAISGIYHDSDSNTKYTGTIKVTGGNITGITGQGVRVGCGIGTISGEGTIIKGNDYGVSTRRGTLTITGGTIEATSGPGVGVVDKGTLTIGINETENPNVDITNPNIIGATHGVGVTSDSEFYFYDGKITGKGGISISGEVKGKPEGYEVQKTQVTDENGTKEEAILVKANYVELDNAQEQVNYYNTLDLAVKNVKEENVIKPLKDIEAEAAAEVPSTQKVTLDLDGKTVKLTGSLTNRGELTIQGAGKLTAETVDTLVNYGTFIKNGECTIDNTTTKGYRTFRNYDKGATATLNEGTLTLSNPTIEGDSKRYVIVNRGNLTISGATVTAMATKTAESEGGNTLDRAIANSTSGVMTVKNGTIQATGLAILQESTGDLNIENGNISSISDAAIDITKESNNLISGGTISSSVSSGNTIKLSVSSVVSNLTIKDNAVIEGNTSYVIGNSSKGTVTIGTEGNTSIEYPLIKGGIYTAQSGLEGATVNLHSGIITDVKAQGIIGNSNINITGGKISIDTIRQCIWMQDGSSDSTVKISGGILESKGTAGTAHAVASDSSASPTIIVSGGEIISAGACGIAASISNITVYGDTNITSKNSGISTGTGTVSIKAKESTNASNVLTGPTITSRSSSGISINGGTLNVGIDETTPSVSTTVPSITGATYGVNIQSGTFNFYDGKITGPEGASISGEEIGKPNGYKVQKTQVTDENGTKEEAILTNKYTVSFSANGGSGGQTANVTATYDAAMPTISKTAPTRTGYTFAGWYDTDAATGGNQYYTAAGASAKTWNKTEDTTLYARWTAKQVEVTFMRNTSPTDTTSDKQTFTYGVSGQTFSAKGWTKTGYTLDGWASDKNATSRNYYVTSGVNWDWINNKSPEVTIYAVWIANTYTVSFSANGGSGGQTANVTATYDATMPTISKTAPTKTGYTFAGWYDTDAATGGNQYYTAAGASAKTWNKTEDTTLYARWTAKTYTVSFDANGGSGGQTANVTATYDAAMPTISTTAPTKTGYTFAGWYDTSAATGGTRYYTAAGASARTWNKTGDTTLYARWTANTYTVEYYQGNNSSTAGADMLTSSSHTYGTAKNLTAYSGTAPSGWTFAGWSANNETTATTVTYEDTASVNNLTDTNKGTVKLYAIFKRDITFKSAASGETSKTVEQRYNPYVTTQVTAVTPPALETVKNWTAIGYRADANAQTATMAAVTPEYNSTTLTYYGVYSRQISFKSGAPTGTVASSKPTQYLNVNGNKVSAVSAPAPTTIANWTVLGYRANTTAADKTYAVTTAAKNISPVYTTGNTMYAVYSRTLTITYTGNGNTDGSTANTTKTIYLNSNQAGTSSQAVTLATNGFTKTGYTFDKWTIGSSDYEGGASYTAGLAYNDSFELTATAKWTANTYTVSFNANGGSGGQTANVTATYGATMPTISKTAPTRAGYIFEGWYDTDVATGGNQYYTAAGASAKTWNKTGNTTLYARWTEANYVELDKAQKQVNYYTTLDLAVKNVKEGNVIKPLKNIESEAAAEVPNTQKATLDLDGKTVKLAGSLTNQGELTIQGTGTLTAETVDTLVNNGTFIKNGECTIDNTTTNGYRTLRNNGTANLNKGILTCSNSEIGTQSRWVIVNSGDLTISGATITARAAADKENSNFDKAIINNNKMATLLIENGSKIESTGYAITNGTSSVYASGSKNAIKVTGGEVLSVNQYAIYNNNSTEGVITVGEESSDSTSEPKIKGGIWSQGNIIVHSGQVTNETNNANFCITSNGDVTITGGYISSSGNTTIRLGSKSGGKTLNISGNSKIECTGNEHSAIGCTEEGQDPTIIVAGGEINSAANRGITNPLGDTIIYGDTKITSVAAGVYTDTGAIIIKAEENRNSNTAKTGPVITSGTYGAYVGQDGSLTIGVKESTGNSVSTTVPSITGATYGVSVQSGTFNFYDGKITGPTGASIRGNVTEKPEGYDVQKTQVTDENGTIEEAILVEKNYAELDNSQKEVNYYNTLDTAVKNAKNGNVIKPLKNIASEVAAEVPSTQKVTLDLNGYTINTSKLITNNGILTIKDSSVQKSGKISTSSYISQLGKFTLESGTIEGKGKNHVIVANIDGSNTIVTGGKIDQTTNGNYHCIDVKQGNLIISGGELTSLYRCIGSGTANNNGVIKISGGTFTATGGSAISYQVEAFYIHTAKELTISGGTFEANKGEERIIDGVSRSAWAAQLGQNIESATISGGTFKSDHVGLGIYGDVTISNTTITSVSDAIGGYGEDASTITINSGTIATSSEARAVVSSNANCNIIVNGGELTGKTFGVRVTSSAKFYFYGGVIKGQSGSGSAISGTPIVQSGYEVKTTTSTAGSVTTETAILAKTTTTASVASYPPLSATMMGKISDKSIAKYSSSVSNSSDGTTSENKVESNSNNNVASEDNAQSNNNDIKNLEETKQEQSTNNVYYTITTDVIEHTESYKNGKVSEKVKGGTITGEDENPYETVSQGKMPQKVIKISPTKTDNEEYEIAKVVIKDGKDSKQEVELDLSTIVDKDGNIELDAKYLADTIRGMQSDKHIEAQFRKKTKVIVKHLEKGTQNALYKTKDGKDYEEITGHEGMHFETNIKPVTNYYASNVEVISEGKLNGVNTDKNMCVTGNMYADALTIVYWYEKVSNAIIVKHIEIDELNKKNGLTLDSGIVLNEEVINCEPNDIKTIARKEYTSKQNNKQGTYISINGPQSNSENIIIATKDEASKEVTYKEDSVIEVRYYYERQFNLSVEIKAHTEDVAGVQAQVNGGKVNSTQLKPYEVILKNGSNNKVIEFIPDNGYRAKYIKVNGKVLDINGLESKNHSVVLKKEYFKNVQEEINIVVEFEKIPAKVIVKYQDAETKEDLIPNKEIIGFVNDEYNEEAVEIEGFLVVAPKPENSNGRMEEDIISMTYLYTRKLSVRNNTRRSEEESREEEEKEEE